MINLDATVTSDGTNKDCYLAYRTTDTRSEDRLGVIRDPYRG
jgi:hypothetical protein